MMRKFKLFLSLRAEEKWINLVQETGYRLVKVNPFLHIYTFEKLNSETDFSPYTRIDFHDENMSTSKYLDYVTMFSDSGWKLVYGSRHGGAQYFQQKNAQSPRDIFSDLESKNLPRKRFINFALTYVILLFTDFFVFIQAGYFNWNNLFNLRSWYLTPGLWNMKGNVFWRAFLFETPFALLRSVFFLFFLIMGIYYILKAIVNGNDVRESTINDK
ncbi:hypothetical protein FD33_GL000929 [Companilactobacillus paralimentarius DSM 13238 = JCM 10415]|uniref:DUF2812 domain-containing protein n=1 Tax=Companilactobacillus paralimentarius DSM 13238 = JCM 10415 TaxID=1122151 RepID=A0A0R1PA65_9LACO|nr:DUF2812 domain-containing protein [Companilactobacillus paralimentarius]KRL29357.1 hypothetical protein FD33_GL000929 [Companilactobacillus paralimentarius DSM 13238 = JCM 10415]